MNGTTFFRSAVIIVLPRGRNYNESKENKLIVVLLAFLSNKQTERRETDAFKMIKQKQTKTPKKLLSLALVKCIPKKLDSKSEEKMLYVC